MKNFFHFYRSFFKNDFLPDRCIYNEKPKDVAAEAIEKVAAEQVDDPRVQEAAAKARQDLFTNSPEEVLDSFKQSLDIEEHPIIFDAQRTLDLMTAPAVASTSVRRAGRVPPGQVRRSRPAPSLPGRRRAESATQAAATEAEPRAHEAAKPLAEKIKDAPVDTYTADDFLKGPGKGQLYPPVGSGAPPITLEHLRGNVQANPTTSLNLRDEQTFRPIFVLKPTDVVIYSTLEYKNVGNDIFVKVESGDKKGWVAQKFLKIDLRNTTAKLMKAVKEGTEKAAAEKARKAAEEQDKQRMSVNQMRSGLESATASPAVPSLPDFVTNPDFHRNFFTLSPKAEALGDKLGLKPNDVIYFLRNEENFAVFERSDGSPIRVHRLHIVGRNGWNTGNFKQLDTDADDDLDKKLSFIFARLDKVKGDGVHGQEMFSGKSIDKTAIGHVRKYGTDLVVPKKNPKSADLYDLIGADGKIVASEVFGDDIEEAKKHEQLTFIFDKLKHVRETYVASLVEKENAAVVTARAQLSKSVEKLDAGQRKSLAEGQELYKKAQKEDKAYTVLDKPVDLIYLSPLRPLEPRVVGKLPANTPVALLGKAFGDKLYSVVTKGGIQGYIQQKDVLPSARLSRVPIDPTLPTAVAAAAATAVESRDSADSGKYEIDGKQWEIKVGKTPGTGDAEQLIFKAEGRVVTMVNKPTADVKIPVKLDGKQYEFSWKNATVVAVSRIDSGKAVAVSLSKPRQTAT